MKKINVLTATVLISGSLLAQNKTYEFKKIQDDPNYVSDKIVVLHLPFVYGKNSSISIGLGLDGVWGITDQIQAEGAFHFLPVVLDGGTGLDFEGGAAFTLAQKSKEKDVKVVLKWSDSQSTNAYSGTTTRTTSAEYINSTATYLTKTKARSGLYYHKTVFVDNSTAFDVTSPLSMTGAYGGLEITKQAALISEVDGKKGITSGFTRIYLDGLFFPITRLNKTGDGLGAGGRIGFWTIFNPNKAKKAAMGKLFHYQAYSTMFFKAEVGVRANEGFFFMTGFGLMLYKNR